MTHIIVLFFLIISSCKATQNLTLTKGLQVNFTSKQGKNIALFIGDSGEGENHLPGVAKDKGLHSKLFSELKFQVEELYNADKERVLTKVASVAKDVGSDGTLLIFYSGHGVSSGAWDIQGQELDFDELATTIFTGRNYKPLQRFVLMSDSCFSGKIAKSASLDAFQKGFHYQTTAKQMIFLGASHPYRTAMDSHDGSAIGMALSKTVRDAKSNNWTVRRWFNETVNMINGFESEQYPNFAAHPVTILDEPLFSDAKDAKAENISGEGACPKSYGKAWHSKFSLDQDNCPNTAELCVCMGKTNEGTFWNSYECSIYPPNSNSRSEAIVSVDMNEGESCERIKCQALFMSNFQKAKSNCRNALIYTNSEGLLDLTVGVPGTSL